MSEIPTSPSGSTATGMSTRRSVLGTAAWTAPVIAFAAAAPAFAASTKRGLNGWVEVQWGDSRITLDGRGTYPNRGLWVSGTKVGDTITNVSIVFYFADTDLVTWETRTGDSGAWTVPVNVGLSTISGTTVRGYSTSYTLPITATAPITQLNNNLVFRTTSNAVAGSSVWARRSVTVNGNVISFLRGPVSPNNRSRQSRSAAPQDLESVQGAATL